MNAVRWPCLLALLLLPPLFFPLLPRPMPTDLHGSVHDANGPVTGASVGIQGQRARTLSAARGRFHLPASSSGRVIASKPGHRIAFQPIGQGPLRLMLEPLPADDNEDYAWIDPTPDKTRDRQCGNCHAEIFREWSGSAHARSATNPRFLELFASGEKKHRAWNLMEEYPEGAGVCASCHAPTYRSPALDYDMRHVEGVAARGVHCDYCHKVVDAPLDKLGTRFGRDGLVLLRPTQDDQLFFGPLDDAVRPGESFAALPLYRDSAYCASCHEGTIFGVHVYGTYSEWRDSPAGKKGQHCQACHMAPTGTMTNLAPGMGGIERAPWTLASHDFPGGTPAMLRRALKLEVKLHAQGSSTEAKVQVRADDVGHRVPTGFIDRHLALVVEGFDHRDQPVKLLQGQILPDAAGSTVQGLPGWLYAKRLIDDAGNTPLPFWKPAEKLIDTRLVPGQADRREFQFAGSLAKVRVRLLYRRFWPQVADVRGWTDNETLVMEQVFFR